MNREVLETQWPQIREILREKFSNLTDEDIRQINGQYDQLVSKLQQKYGYSREEAEERIRSWNFDRFAANRDFNGARDLPVKDRIVREEKARREEDYSTALKWLLALGIPLLLLGGYFLSTARAPEVTNSPSVVQERVVTEAPADRTISVGLRDALFAQPALANEVPNIQITTQNGIVTLSGNVSSREMRDTIVNRAESFAGVRQVIDNLQVR